MSEPTPREILELANHKRRVVSGVDWAMANLRLGRNPVVHRKSRLLGWRKDRSTPLDEGQFETVPACTVEALYLALRKVRLEAQREADRLESRVHVDGGDRADQIEGRP